ncbi:MAG TPA: tetraacyldisaccharide 4'-kinase [Terriglobales bacterium]|nr:tetraacyldisaccharide 4'-kinase [Terriglobales bacterium]
MSVLGSIYGSAAYTRNALYDRGLLHSRHLEGPVISVGNLSVGGSGKTPFTILLGKLLKSRGIKFDVLSRGYGRDTRSVLLVDPSGSPREFGDEPILIARTLQAPVIVGKSRHEAGLFAEQKFGPQLHILDDGFQHRSLARDFDIVLVSSRDMDDGFLPAGRLREPPSSLQRADAVVTADHLSQTFLLHLNKPVWTIRRGVVVENSPTRPIVFCGIAQPALFLSQLRMAGIEPAGEMVFRDHHRYGPRDVQSLQKLRDQRQANGFITTEKDAINLAERLGSLQPVAVAQVTMELEDSANAVDTMLRMISSRSPRHEKILSSHE